MRTLAFLVALALSGSAAAAGNCKLVRIAEWPVRLHNNRVVVDGSINGQDVGVLLDTGAYRSSLSRSAARRLGLELREMQGERSLGVGGVTRVWLAELEEVRIAGAVRKNWRVPVVGEREFDRDSSFILGYDFFHQIDVEFDLPHAAVRLFQPSDCKDVSLAYWAGQGTASETKIAWTTSSDHMSVPIDLNGRRLEALLDSGASMSVVGLATAAELGFTPETPGVTRAGNLAGVGDSLSEYWIAQFQKFAIGNEVINNPSIAFTRLSSYFGASPTATTWDAWPVILGVDFLRAHRVYVAHSQGKVYFTYAGGPVFSHKADPKQDQERSIAAYNESLRANPKSAAVYYNRALSFLAKGDSDAAIADYSEAIKLNPKYASAYFARANAWVAKGDIERAIADYDEVIHINPQDSMAHFYRGMAWNRRGVATRAQADYEAAVSINPDDAAAFNNFAWMLAVSKDDATRDGKRAIDLAKRACDLTSWENAGYLDTLAAAYAEAGDFSEAARWQEKALALPELKSNKQAQARLELYRAGKPYREQRAAP